MLGLVLAVLGSAIAGPTTFRCCDDRNVTAAVDAYLGLHEGLHERLPAARLSGHVYKLRAALGRLRGRGGPDGALIGVLYTVADEARDRPLAEIRDAFARMGTPMIALALRHEGTGIPLAEAACGDRAWLQRDTAEVQSPFGGDCGAWR